MDVKSFGLAWFISSDFEKTKKLFSEVLGLKLEVDDPKFSWLEYKAKEGGSKIGVGKYNPHEPVKPGQNAVLTFTVSDIQAAKKELEGKSVKVIGDILEIPDEVYLLTFSDHDGNLFQLVELIRKS